MPLRDDLPFRYFAEEWYKEKKEPNISTATRASYKTMLEKHIYPVFGNRHLRAIQAMEIQRFINRFAGKSGSQITLAMGIIKSVFANAYADGIIERDPTVSLVRPRSVKKKQERRALTLQET